MKFKAELSWDKHGGGESIFEKGVVYRFDTPKEFGGEANYPSPEELFFSSVGACIITSFLYFRKKLGFSMNTLRASVEGKLERTDEGHSITGLVTTMLVEIDNGEEEEKVKKCFKLTKNFCPITRTLKNCIPIDLKLRIEVFSPAGQQASV